LNFKPTTRWILASVAVYLAGSVWRWADPENFTGTDLKIIGWLSFLVAVGFAVRPSNPWLGRIFFTFVVVMTIGLCVKIFHLAFANEIIIAGLSGMVVTYVWPLVSEGKVG
jgi:uncharacterized membrane protein YccC